MKGYSTKYALTQGISEVKIDTTYGGEPDGKYVYTASGSYRMQLIVGKTFFENQAEALANARLQAVRKLAALDKQRKKLTALAVEPKWSKE